MEFGVLVDAFDKRTVLNDAPERALQWVRDTPQRSWWSLAFKAAPEDRLQVATLRCTTCAFVELYAPSDLDETR